MNTLRITGNVMVRLCRIATSFRFIFAVLLAIAVCCLWRGILPGPNQLERMASEIRDPKFRNWYGEVKNHNYSGDWKSNTGHFTQIIWKDTKEVGFGKCRDKGGNIYVVANYYPAGNVLGYFKYNVSRP